MRGYQQGVGLRSARSRRICVLALTRAPPVSTTRPAARKRLKVRCFAVSPLFSSMALPRHSTPPGGGRSRCALGPGSGAFSLLGSELEAVGHRDGARHGPWRARLHAEEWTNEAVRPDG